MRTCGSCGVSIEHKRRDARFCCDHCRDQARYPRKPKKCKRCGASFIGVERKFFCSRHCWSLSRRKPQQPKNCKRCGEPFMGHSRHVYCSEECRQVAAGKMSLNRGKDWLSGPEFCKWLTGRVGEETLVGLRRREPSFARRWTDWKNGKDAYVYVVDSYLVPHLYIYLWEIPDELFTVNKRVRQPA